MKKSYKGRTILPSAEDGQVLVSQRGFNSLACFYQSILSNSDLAVCSDQDNPDLFGQVLTDKIVCTPCSTGSTTAGATWLHIAKLNMAPKAMLFSQSIDSLAAAGLILVEVWLNKRICTIDRLGDEFLNTVKSGMSIRIQKSGLVEIL